MCHFLLAGYTFPAWLNMSFSKQKVLLFYFMSYYFVQLYSILLNSISTGITGRDFLMEKDQIVIREILVAAKSLFGKLGLKKTTIDDISAASGKGKNTLYNYFPGKNEIFEAVVRDEMQTVVKNLEQTVDAAPTAKFKLKAFLGLQSAALIELRSLYKVLFEDMIESRKMLMPLRVSYENTQIKMISGIIQGGVSSAEFKYMSDTHIHRLSLVLIIAFRGLHFPLSIHPAEIQAHEYFDALVDMLIEGIGN
jgi:AcrR family transcriptional regulator